MTTQPEAELEAALRGYGRSCLIQGVGIEPTYQRL